MPMFQPYNTVDKREKGLLEAEILAKKKIRDREMRIRSEKIRSPQRFASMSPGKVPENNV
jgi:hypothetical protein